ncbi:ATP synthase F1, beta subunit, partial [Vibrio parahaemolyticus EKP-028]
SDRPTRFYVSSARPTSCWSRSLRHRSWRSADTSALQRAERHHCDSRYGRAI